MPSGLTPNKRASFGGEWDEKGQGVPLGAQSAPRNDDEVAKDWPMHRTDDQYMVNNYLMCALLGQGSYGKVREGIDINTGRRVAVKAIQREKVKKVKGALQAVEQEIMIMRQLSGRRFAHYLSKESMQGSDADDEFFILKLYDVIRTPRVIYIVMERAFGTLDALLDCQVNRVLPLPTTQYIFRQLMLGVEWLHAHGVIHKDIKPSNIMISLSGGIKLVDFGVSEVLSLYSKSSTCHSSQGTPMFQAPEVVCGKPFSGPPSDVWSCGVILYLMVTGRLPFNGNGLYQLMQNIKRGEFSTANIPIPCLSLVKAMLDKDPATRMTVDNILWQPWVGRMVPVNCQGNPLIWCASKAALVPHLSTEGFDQWNDDGASDGETAFSGACSAPFGPLSIPVTNEFEMQLNSQLQSQGITFGSLNASRRLAAEASAHRKESLSGDVRNLPGFADVTSMEDPHAQAAASPLRLRPSPQANPSAASHPQPPSSCQNTAPLSGSLSAVFHTEYFHFPQSASFSSPFDLPRHCKEPKESMLKLALKLKTPKNSLQPGTHAFGTMTMDDALLGRRQDSPKASRQRSFVPFMNNSINSNGRPPPMMDAVAPADPVAGGLPGSSNFGGTGVVDEGRDGLSPLKFPRQLVGGSRITMGPEDGALDVAPAGSRPRSQSHPTTGIGAPAGGTEHFIEVEEAEEEHNSNEYSGYHSMGDVLPTSGLLIRPTHHFQAHITDVMVSTEPLGQDHLVQNFVTKGTRAKERLLVPGDVDVEVVIKAIHASKATPGYRLSKSVRAILANISAGGCMHVACTDKDHIFAPSPIALNVAICPVMRANSRLLFVAYLQRLFPTEPFSSLAPESWHVEHHPSGVPSHICLCTVM